MSAEVRSEITRLLRDLDAQNADRRQTTELLLAALYPELRRLAAGLFRKERAEHTLQPTAVVHEAYLRLVSQDGASWRDRAHFLGIAARVMRQVLVDHARTRAAQKRGGDRERVTLTDAAQVGSGGDLELLDLHQALERFASLDPRASRVVELRVFGGLTVEETAHVIGVSSRTVTDDWAMARLWLARELGPGTTP